MGTRSIIHMLSPEANTSPFDINMAVDAGFDVVVPYAHVEPAQVNGLIQDAIFSRAPKQAKRTAVFIGGRDINLAMHMLAIAKKAMVPSLGIPVMVDPSGAFTTAAALVACVEKELKAKHGMDLADSRAVIFGGTGPVGLATGVIASREGADTTIVHHGSIQRAQELAAQYNDLCGASMRGTFGASEADKAYLLAHTDIVFCASKAGVEMLVESVLGQTETLKVAGDINAVPPLGIRGIGLKDFGAPLKHATSSTGAVGIGALAIGDVKNRLQQTLLKMMLDTDEPLYLDMGAAFKKARELV